MNRSSPKIVLLICACLAAGCTGASDRDVRAGKAPVPGMVTVLVPAGNNAANLEVRLIPETDFGPAVLTVAGEGITVLPAPERQLRLAPPAPPPPVTHGPYPLGRVLIEVFRLRATTRGPHLVRVTLTWKGGRLSRQIHWSD